MDLVASLHTPTLAFVTGLAGIVLAGVMLGIRLAGLRNPALVYWGLAGLAFGLGHQMGHLFLTYDLGVPLPAALAIANAQITLTHVLLLAGVGAYLGRPTWIGPLLLVGALLILLGLVWEPMQQSLRVRVLVLSGMYLTLDAISGLRLWLAPAQGVTAFRRFAACVFLFNSTFLSVRFAYAAMSGSGLTTSFVQDPFQILFFVVSLVFIFVLTPALALLMFRGTEMELRRLVHRDALTGLFNRRSLFELAAREEARSLRYRTPLSLLMLDIDHFKTVNDTHGHAAGDEVIAQAAVRISEGLRDVDAAFRLGGEEFLILLPSTELDAAMAVAERLRAEMSREPMGIGRITVSLGVAQLDAGREGWESTMRRADAALYRAKREGRDRVVASRTPVLDADDAQADAVLDLP